MPFIKSETSGVSTNVRELRTLTSYFCEYLLYIIIVTLIDTKLFLNEYIYPSFTLNRIFSSVIKRSVVHPKPDTQFSYQTTRDVISCRKSQKGMSFVLVIDFTDRVRHLTTLLPGLRTMEDIGTETPR